MTDTVDGDVRALVARAVTLDPDAWETVYRRAYPRLFAYARRRLRSDTEADDAVSETLARALARISAFTWEGAGFDAWLYGILRNVLLESFRATGRTTVAGVPEPTVPSPLDELVGREQLADVRQAFGRLSAEDQELLELRVVAGLSADGVGAVTGQRPGAVRMAQSRALGRLRTLFEEVSGAR